MIAIYDFDGTLTPYSLPQYPILRHCGYTNKALLKRIAKEMIIGKKLSFYEAYYKCYTSILTENGIEMLKNNVCLKAQHTKLNHGVEEYFKRFQSSKSGIKHYIVTSGIRDFVEETAIGDLVNGIYGVTFTEENGTFQDVDLLLTDKTKVDVIKQIQNENSRTNDIIYFGDGLTDAYAFDYVHSIGGKTVFVASNIRSKSNYKKLNANGIIDEYFKADFGPKSDIVHYVQSQILSQLDYSR